MYYTVYKTTNKINGKIYIGCHKTKDLDDGYIGSGKYLQYAINKHGIENFEKEIIAVFDKASEMFEMESELVNEDFVKDDTNYNLKIGGQGGWDYVNENCGNQGERLNKVLTNEQRRLGGYNASKGGAQSLAAKAIREKRNCPIFDKKFRDNCADAFRGKKHSDETKRKIGESNSIHQRGEGNSQYGTMWICNVELKENKKIRKDDPIPDGWIKGRK